MPDTIIKKITKEDLVGDTAELGDNVVMFTYRAGEWNNFVEKLTVRELLPHFGKAELLKMLSMHAQLLSENLTSPTGHLIDFATDQLRLLRQVTNFFRFKVADVFGAAMALVDPHDPEGKRLRGAAIQKTLNLNTRNAIPKERKVVGGEVVVKFVEPLRSGLRHKGLEPKEKDLGGKAKKTGCFMLGKRTTETSFAAMLAIDPEAIKSVYEKRSRNRSIKGCSNEDIEDKDLFFWGQYDEERAKLREKHAKLWYKPKRVKKD